MVGWALNFLVIGGVAALLQLAGIAGAAHAAKILLAAFILLTLTGRSVAAPVPQERDLGSPAPGRSCSC